jgi:hypothetical protein
MTDIIKTDGPMEAFAEHLKDNEKAVATVLNCHAVQELLTIYHICGEQPKHGERSKNCSIARLLNNPELLQKLCFQMRFDEIAAQQILCSEAVAAPSKQNQALDR